VPWRSQGKYHQKEFKKREPHLAEVQSMREWPWDDQQIIASGFMCGGMSPTTMGNSYNQK